MAFIDNFVQQHENWNIFLIDIFLDLRKTKTPKHEDTLF
jgi:hypothetical protein